MWYVKGAGIAEPFIALDKDNHLCLLAVSLGAMVYNLCNEQCGYVHLYLVKTFYHQEIIFLIEHISNGCLHTFARLDAKHANYYY